MDTVKDNKIIEAATVAILIMIGIISMSGNQSVAAHDDNPHSSTIAQANNSKQEQAKQNQYSYTAQPGDAYSLLARKAVQTYGLLNKVNLTEAQIIAAETNLTNAAGAPELIIGQRVDLKPADVKAAVESAKKLSLEQQAAWLPYVASVDFNTNNVGE